MFARSHCLALVMACTFLALGCDEKPKAEVSEEFKGQLYQFLREASLFEQMAGADVLLEREQQQLLSVKVSFGSLLSIWPARFSPISQRDFRAAINDWDLGFGMESVIRKGGSTKFSFPDGDRRTPTRAELAAAYAEASARFAEGRTEILASLPNDPLGR
jgi:hypothetical protein